MATVPAGTYAINPPQLYAFSYQLWEVRSDTLITTPATLYFESAGRLDSVRAVNGVFQGQARRGTLRLLMVRNADTFQSDRVLKPGGSLLGVNWPENDGLTLDLQADFPSPGVIQRLALQGSPYESLSEMMRIYGLVWAPDGKHVVPIFPVSTIAIYIGPPTWPRGLIDPQLRGSWIQSPQGAIDTRAQFAAVGFEILIDTISVMPADVPANIPEAVQVVGLTTLLPWQ